MRRLVAADGADAFVQLSVGGRAFETTIGHLTGFPNSVLAALWQQHRQGSDPKGPMRVDGDPSLFHLILNYLRRGKLPVVTDVSQLQWLEAEAEEYKLNGEGELADLCRNAYKRLDTVKVIQLLNGQRNLSGMDMRRLDLSNIDFRGASMYRARADEAVLSDAMLSGMDTNLRHASFRRAKASRAVFREAQIEEATFCGATLTEASFVGANACKADFGEAELSGAILSGAKLAEASFVEAVAPNADFSKAGVKSAKLCGAKLAEASFAEAAAPKADFSRAELSNATLSGANLAEASFREAVARNADFSKANLSGADLQSTDLTAADLSGANLSGANLAGVNLSGATFTGATFAGALNLRAATFDHLRGAILNGLDLTGVDLGGKDLSGANLAGANLASANLAGANLSDVNLASANLIAVVNLSGANLTRTNFAGALMAGVEFDGLCRAKDLVSVEVSKPLNGTRFQGGSVLAGPNISCNSVITSLARLASGCMMAISVHFGTGGDSDQYFGVLNRNCNGESNSRLREAGGWCVRGQLPPLRKRRGRLLSSGLASQGEINQDVRRRFGWPSVLPLSSHRADHIHGRAAGGRIVASGRALQQLGQGRCGRHSSSGAAWGCRLRIKPLP